MAIRNQGLAHPAHVTDKGGTFISRVKPSSPTFEINGPYEEEAIIRVPKGCQILRVWAECNAANTESMLAQNCQRDIER